MKTKKENRAIILKGIKLLVSSTESETSNETQEINHALVIKWIEWSVFIFSAESKIEIETQINWTNSFLSWIKHSKGNPRMNWIISFLQRIKKLRTNPRKKSCHDIKMNWIISFLHRIRNGKRNPRKKITPWYLNELVNLFSLVN